MLRVMLLSSPLTVEERYGAFAGAGNTQPTYALPCLGAIAQQSGVEVRLLDASAEGLTIEQTLTQIRAYQPTLVGISSTTVGIVASAELARGVKQIDPRILTILGGCHVTAIPEETLAEFESFDIGVIGEGELTFAEILQQIKEHDALRDDTDGTVVRQAGTITVNPPRPRIENLDTLPFPAWKLLGTKFPRAFTPSPSRIKRFPCASVVFTRGCPNQCHFCDRSVFGNRVRSVSPEYAVTMLKELRYDFGVKEILIEDDTFIISRQRIQEFCERLIADKVDITWSCLGRADYVNSEMLQLMKRAGCWHISYGIESGDQRILDAMCKNETLAQIESAIRWTKEAGIQAKGFFMVGFPGETLHSLQLTKEFALRLPLDDISVMQLTPFPGSAVYDYADEYGMFERDWRKMNVLNTVFIPTGFTKAELENFRRDIFRAFYFRPSILFQKFRETISNPRMVRHLLKGFGVLLKLKNQRRD